jgi:hypothetical protein
VGGAYPTGSASESLSSILESMKNYLSSLFLIGAATVGLGSAIAPLFPTLPPVSAQLQNQAQPVPNPGRLPASSVYSGQGTLRFQGQTSRIHSFEAVPGPTEQQTLTVILDNQRRLRLGGTLAGDQFVVAQGSFNPVGDSGDADVNGRLTVTRDRGMITGFQGQVVFDGQPIEINFSRYEAYTGQGNLQFRNQSTTLTRIDYHHWEANQPKRLTLHLADGRQVSLQATAQPQSNGQRLQVQSGSFGMIPGVVSSDADFVGELTVNEQADGRWRSLSGSLKFDGQPMEVRFAAAPI